MSSTERARSARGVKVGDLPKLVVNERVLAVNEPALAANEPTLPVSEPTLIVSKPTLAVNRSTLPGGTYIGRCRGTYIALSSG